MKLGLLISGLFAGLVLLLVGSAQGAPGSVDESFNGTSQAKRLAAADDLANALALRPDGKLVAAGESRGDLALARYKPNGSLDPSFGGDGRVVTSALFDLFGARALAPQPDGKLVVVGGGSNGDFELARYNPDGSLDKSFGKGGKVNTVLGDDDEANAVVLQPDGKLIAAGQSFALARYNANGALDPSFGTGGKVTTPFGSDYAVAFALVLQPDGKLVAAGDTETGSNHEFALARYNPDGSLDPSFGTGGKVTTAFSGDLHGAYSLVLQPDGKLVAGGYIAGPNYGAALARYNADGSLDPSFGGDGRVTTALFGADALVLQPDGKLLATGGSPDGLALARYNPDGSLDTSFNRTGEVTTKIRSHAAAQALALQPDGKLVAAGYTYTGSTDQHRLSADFALARYKPDGSLDGSFGRGGKVTTKFRCVVPNVKGMKLPVAKLAIGREDCSVGKVSRAFSPTVGKGSVISQKPKPGANREPGSRVKLTVSRGKKRPGR